MDFDKIDDKLEIDLTNVENGILRVSKIKTVYNENGENKLNSSSKIVMAEAKCQGKYEKAYSDLCYLEKVDDKNFNISNARAIAKEIAKHGNLKEDGKYLRLGVGVYVMLKEAMGCNIEGKGFTNYLFPEDRVKVEVCLDLLDEYAMKSKSLPDPNYILKKTKALRFYLLNESDRRDKEQLRTNFVRSNEL